MKIAITPKEFERKGIATHLNWSVCSYERNSNYMQVSWVLTGIDNTLIEEGVETLGESVVTKWSSSDECIDKAIAEKIKVEIMEIITTP